MVIDLAYSKKYPDSVVFCDVSWQFYRAMLREFDEQPSRINYDRGTLEIMALPLEHERYKSLIGSMVSWTAMTFGVQLMHGGSSTLKRFSKQRGLEADQCYWTNHAAVMRAKTRLDLRTDPPPDLVVEIEVMRSMVNRRDLCRALRVPELWVLRRDSGLSAFRLQDRTWEPIDHSLSFPFLRVGDLNPFVARIGVDDDTSVVEDFLDWLRALRG